MEKRSITGEMMKTNAGKSGRGEKGYALLLVLILLFFGSLVVSPLLGYMNTGLKTGMIYQENVFELFAADAGINDGLWYAHYGDLESQLGPTYDEYDHTSTWSYSLSEKINARDVAVTVENVWIPQNVATPNKVQARTIIESGKLIVTSNAPDAATYQIKIAFYPDTGDNLTIETLGLWLPPGFSYVTGSSNLEVDPFAHYYPASVQITPHAGGQAVVWNFSSVPLLKFPGVNPADLPLTSTITLQFTSSELGQLPVTVSWITTSQVSSVPFAWDADTTVYRLTSTAGDTTVEAYVVKSKLRQLGSAMPGDYLAIGNTLMTATGDDRYRDRLIKESSATVDADDIPATATIQAAWLYWSGWIEGGNEIIIWQDDCANFDNWSAGGDWEVYSGEFRGRHIGDESDRYLTVASSLDFSSYQGQIVTISWEQDESGTLESGDSLEFVISNDGGSTWSDIIVAFSDDNPDSPFSYTIPYYHLTANFKIRFYLDNFGGSDEYAYIDNITVTLHEIKVDTVLFNGNEITADRQQFQENDDRPETVGTWSYSSFYDATVLVGQLIDDGDIATNGSGTYTLGHIVRERTGYPGYSFELYPTFEDTGYPLGIPALASGTRYEYAYAGWSLILIYVSPETEGHQLYLYDDFTFVGNTESLQLSVSGFLTPDDPTGSRLTCFVGEGDFRYTGDYIKVNNFALSDAINPANNVWNSYSNTLDNPSVNGIDLDTFDISSYLDAGDTSATIELGTDIEIYNSIYVILSFRSDSIVGGTVTYLIK